MVIAGIVGGLIVGFIAGMLFGLHNRATAQAVQADLAKVTKTK